ncbi:MAG: DsrE family protein [Pseudomonadota bacterium]|nr:DsrE family protein [Pseudomonadota bacterium]
MTDSSSRVLVFLTQSALSGQTLYEAIAAIMVMATYGQVVQVAFCQDAIDSLNAQATDQAHGQQPFKSVQAMIESFEFYDLLPVWVCAERLPNRPIVDCICMPMHQINTQQFKAVLTW